MTFLSPRTARADPGSDHVVWRARRSGADPEPGARRVGQPFAGSVGLALPGRKCRTCARGGALPAPSPAASASPSPAPAAPPPAAAATPAPVQTADPFGLETTLEPKKVVMVKGTANWDSAFDTLIDAFKALNTLLDKQGIKPAGNSMIVYTSTDDTGFTFLAEIPVEQDPKNLRQGHEHRQIAGRQGAEIRPSRLLRQHGQHL